LRLPAPHTQALSSWTDFADPQVLRAVGAFELEDPSGTLQRVMSNTKANPPDLWAVNQVFLLIR
jgi:hypothetical protein